jgi:site-specific recombinase XerD
MKAGAVRGARAAAAGLLGVRDRALLTLGFAGDFSRSELVALDVAALRFVPGRELEIKLRGSKTDQERWGQEKEIALGRRTSTCPVTAIKDWLELAAITNGPLFRAVSRYGTASEKRLTDQVVALVVKRSLVAAGVRPDEYSGHSLRAGLVTVAKQPGVKWRDYEVDWASVAADHARVRSAREALGEPSKQQAGFVGRT